MKSFNLKFKLELYPECKRVKGFRLKRDLIIKEARHILKNILGIAILDKDDCDDSYEYQEYNTQLLEDVQSWLKGDTDDETIMMEYAGDCGDENIGIFNVFPMVEYLIKREII